ncbi:hypothetical protein LH450_00690 [Laribacter hongkongensis]|uniref:hypothetical protein n=1 Tax=Laribacter hongkongensis TaxID=168471 RepID=UPI001EFE1862|nr:hypothetical protein [Laribacter hongkongensis]MCG9006076.1 hypothetical protein [Laribacter hongkongensis]MCG9016451.1 hypothetical protein [Laribacter hongkongensis]
MSVLLEALKRAEAARQSGLVQETIPRPAPEPAATPSPARSLTLADTTEAATARTQTAVPPAPGPARTPGLSSLSLAPADAPLPATETAAITAPEATRPRHASTGLSTMPGTTSLAPDAGVSAGFPTAEQLADFLPAPATAATGPQPRPAGTHPGNMPAPALSPAPGHAGMPPQSSSPAASSPLASAAAPALPADSGTTAGNTTTIASPASAPVATAAEARRLFEARPAPRRLPQLPARTWYLLGLLLLSCTGSAGLLWWLAPDEAAPLPVRPARPVVPASAPASEPDPFADLLDSSPPLPLPAQPSAAVPAASVPATSEPQDMAPPADPTDKAPAGLLHNRLAADGTRLITLHDEPDVARLLPLAPTARMQAAAPASSQAEVSAAQEAMQQGDWMQAQAHWFAAVAAAPTQPDYRFNLAVTLDRLGETGLAARQYAEALQLAETANARFDRTAARRRLAEIGEQP